MYVKRMSKENECHLGEGQDEMLLIHFFEDVCLHFCFVFAFVDVLTKL